MSRAGTLAAWTNAWLDGRAASDEVLRSVGTDSPNRVRGLPGSKPDELIPLAEVLIEWRRGGGRARLVLPVAGDVRGLPGPADFRAAALTAGEAVFCGRLGLVPELRGWFASALDEPPHDPLFVPDAQHELTEAIRETASALAAASVASWVTDVADALRDARRAGERLSLPPGHPQRAVQLLSQAERLQAVLALADADPTGGAIDRAGIAARADALRPLARAVRRARMAAYSAVAEE